MGIRRKDALFGSPGSDFPAFADLACWCFTLLWEEGGRAIIENGLGGHDLLCARHKIPHLSVCLFFLLVCRSLPASLV